MLLRSDPLPIWRLITGLILAKRVVTLVPRAFAAAKISGRDWDGTGFVRDATA